MMLPIKELQSLRHPVPLTPVSRGVHTDLHTSPLYHGCTGAKRATEAAFCVGASTYDYAAFLSKRAKQTRAAFRGNHACSPEAPMYSTGSLPPPLHPSLPPPPASTESPQGRRSVGEVSDQNLHGLFRGSTPFIPPPPPRRVMGCDFLLFLFSLSLWPAELKSPRL